MTSFGSAPSGDASSRMPPRARWIALVAVSSALSLVEPMYLAAAYLLRLSTDGSFQGMMGAAAAAFAETAKWYAAGIAVLAAAASFAVRRSAPGAAARAASAPISSAFGPYASRVVAAMAVCETGGALGLLYFLLSGDIGFATVLFGIAFAGKLGLWPKKAEFLAAESLLGSRVPDGTPRGPGRKIDPPRPPEEKM